VSALTQRLVAALLLGAGAAAAQPASYRLDPQHSFVHFEVLHFGTSTIRGRIGPVAGQVILDRGAGRGELGVRVSTASVDTGVFVFDARLRQADMLASAAHAEAFFVARQLRFTGEQVTEVRGEFTLRGASQPLALRALRFGCYADPDSGREACAGDFEGSVLRSDFGITFGLPFVGDRVRLLVQVRALRE
jgi:polyisoprenoid-binding protein YceI